MKRNILYTLAFLTAAILGTFWIVSPSQNPAEDPELVQREGLSRESESATITDTPATAKPTAILDLEEERQDNILQENVSEEAESLFSISLSVDGKVYSTSVEEGSTVIDAMQKNARESEFTFETRTFPGTGEFVESINGKKSSNGFYWFLYINGESSNVGASQTILSPGDEVEWRYKQME